MPGRATAAPDVADCARSLHETLPRQQTFDWQSPAIHRPQHLVSPCLRCMRVPACAHAAGALTRSFAFSSPYASVSATGAVAADLSSSKPEGELVGLAARVCQPLTAALSIHLP